MSIDVNIEPVHDGEDDWYGENRSEIVLDYYCTKKCSDYIQNEKERYPQFIRPFHSATDLAEWVTDNYDKVPKEDNS
jgi:hypothetical protein